MKVWEIWKLHWNSQQYERGRTGKNFVDLYTIVDFSSAISNVWKENSKNRVSVCFLFSIIPMLIRAWNCPLGSECSLPIQITINRNNTKWQCSYRVSLHAQVYSNSSFTLNCPWSSSCCGREAYNEIRNYNRMNIH